MDKRRTADEAARDLCRQLYEVTDGWSMEWRVVLGGASTHAALEHAIQHGWLLFDDEDSRICLTEKGRRVVRKRLS